MHEKYARWARLLAASAAFASLDAAAEERVACHLTYGGETTVHYTAPVTSPYGVAPLQVGSYFLFRVVFQKAPAEQAAIKITTYADKEGGPVPLQQSTFPYPPVASADATFGFTGRQLVYEPVRDGELEYWCGLQTITALGAP
jgi:hypothetical protein